MRVSINILAASAEVFASIRQMLDLIRSALDEQFPAVSGMPELSIGLTIVHPSCGVPCLRGSDSYSERAGVFYGSASIQYAAWVIDGWKGRVAAFADALTRAVKAIHKTRIAESERLLPLALIEERAFEISSNPPDRIVEGGAGASHLCRGRVRPFRHKLRSIDDWPFADGSDYCRTAF